MKRYLISVLLPVYNAEEYIQEAISSILNQTYKEFELIIINDCSTDKSLEIINSFKDKRIKTFSNKKNLGIVESLNKAISYSSGDFIARMDADDISLPNRLITQLTYILAHNIDVCGSGMFYINRNKLIILFPNSHIELEKILLFYSCLYHPTIFAKTEVFKRLKYEKKYQYAEDYRLWTKFIMNNFKIANFPEKLLGYRFSKQQISNQKKEEQRLISNKISHEYFLYILNKYRNNFKYRIALKKIERNYDDTNKNLKDLYIYAIFFKYLYESIESSKGKYIFLKGLSQRLYIISKFKKDFIKVWIKLFKNNFFRLIIIVIPFITK